MGVDCLVSQEEKEGEKGPDIGEVKVQGKTGASYSDNERTCFISTRGTSHVTRSRKEGNKLGREKKGSVESKTTGRGGITLSKLRGHGKRRNLTLTLSEPKEWWKARKRGKRRAAPWSRLKGTETASKD